MSTPNDNKIINKIRALLNKTVENGATEAEAQQALIKAYELMAAHHVSEADTVQVAKTYIQKFVKFKAPYNTHRWVSSLLKAIADHNQVWRLLGSKPGSYILFGTAENIELTEQFFDYAYNCAITYGKPKFKLQSDTRYGFWLSYGIGFATGVETLFNNITKESGSTALVLSNLQTVKDAYPSPTRTVNQRRVSITANNFQNGVTDGKNLRKSVQTNVQQNGPKQLTSRS